MVSVAHPLPATPAALPHQPQWQLSPLELLLPTGRAAHPLQLGSRPLPSLNNEESGILKCRTAAPPNTTPSPDTSIDLYLLAPTTQECATPGWLTSAVRHLAHTLTPDGLACLLVPPRWRPPLLRLLHQHQLTIPLTLLHYPHPAAAGDTFIAPLHPTLLTYAFDTLTPNRSPQQTFALTLLRLPTGRSLLQTILPTVSLIARHPGAAPLFDWLTLDEPNESPPANAIISYGRDGNQHTAILHTFTGRRPHPTTIYKLALNDPAETTRRRETANLARLPLPSTIRLPMTRPIHLPDGRLLLRQETLPGRVVARMLAAQPTRLPALLAQVVNWLAQWHETTAVYQPAGDWLAQELLPLARQLVPLLPGGPDYLQSLSAHVAGLSNRPLPLVAAHHDLTMWNLLYDEQAGLAVLDWESAAAPALPLTDFYYALADAAAAAPGYRDRLAAFRHCFTPGGRWQTLAAQLEAQLCQPLAIPPALALLCFHACWLRHAANEQRKQQPPAERPFLAMLAWAAQHRPLPAEAT